MTPDSRADHDRETPATPTGEQFAAYQALVRYFNDQLFAGALPPVLLNFSRKGRQVRGFFAPDRWEKGAATGRTRLASTRSS